MIHDRVDPERRRALQLLIGAPAAFLAVVALRTPGARAATRAASPPRATFPPTPECADDDAATPEETEGPFFKPRSPRRSSLIEPGMKGTRLSLGGRVFAHDCRPVPGALLDFWHADDDGEYDNAGFRLRGHQFADALGRFQLDTIVPGLYTGRTRHIHVKVQAPHRPVLTTQLYFPGEPRNGSDGLFRSDLLMVTRRERERQRGWFHFVLDLA